MAMIATPQLSEALIVETMSWLPVKSIIRFRSVCKTLNSLIFDSEFVKLHLQRSSRNTNVLVALPEYIMNHNGLVSHIQTIVASCSIPRLLQDPSAAIDDICLRIDFNYQVLGVSNGLVCLEDGTSRKSFGHYHVQFWNPATRVMSKNSPLLRGYPVKSGFGYDDQSDTYKVVAMLFNPNSCNWELNVYSMGDISWRSILKCSPFHILDQVYGQFVSGTLNWLARLSRQLTIFSYDLKSERYRFLSLADDIPTMTRGEPHLGVLKGCLCLSQVQRRTNFVLWIMTEFGVERSWTMLLNISCWHEILDFLFCPGLIPVCTSENYDMVLLGDANQLVLVDKKTNTIYRSHRIQDFIGGLPFYYHDYVPSLIMPYQN